MSISLNALEHLGINLYSNIPAVLSEIVANAWDADANHVSVRLNKYDESITIEDDGAGMDRDGVVDRFLTVGYRRREALGATTPAGRQPMGRKGIGKLSIFSIARITTVYTALRRERTAFRMDREVIRKAIEDNTEKVYKPEELPLSKFPSDLRHGTRIILSGLSRSISGMTGEGLRRRVARRFSVIGAKHGFVVDVDGIQIGPEDRNYHNAVQYLWTYGDQAEFERACKHVERPPERRMSAISARLAAEGIGLTGWIATVAKPEQLKDSEGDNLNRIAIFMRGKLAQEDVLDEFGEKEIYADYLIGELHCEELDSDDERDIATSSRQELNHDDPRYEALKKIVKSELRHIAGRWSDWRRSDGAKAAISVPEVGTWLDSLEGSTRKKAERWIGKLNTIRSPKDSDKKELLKASILAFESYRRKEELERLEDIQDENLGEVLNIFRSIDDLELSYYGQIVRGRVQVIRALQDKLKKDKKESLLREYIYEHLWLLDPSWERTRGTEHAETIVSKFLDRDTRELKGPARKARIDIGYRTTMGKHVIVELKRASVVVPLDDLIKQIRKYRDGVRKVLATIEQRDWPMEIVCLVGKPPPEWHDGGGTGRQGVIDGLATVNARIVFYDELLINAQKAYADYLTAHVKIDKLWGVFRAIEDFAPPQAIEATKREGRKAPPAPRSKR